MHEEYVKVYPIVEKTEQEKQTELVMSIIKTKKELEEASRNFEYAEGELIDYYTYQIKASRAKIDYLVKRAKEQGLVLDMIDQLEMRFREAM